MGWAPVLGGDGMYKDTKQALGDLDLRYLKLDCSNDPLTNTLNGANALFTGTLGSGTHTIGGATGVTLAAADGILTFASIGGSYNEGFTIDMDTTDNCVYFAVAGAAQFRTTSWNFADGMTCGFGAHATPGEMDAGFKWNTTGDYDHLNLCMYCGSEADSGYFIICTAGDQNDADRLPTATSANPVLRIYSTDDTNATDYLEFFHNQTTAIIQAGDGAISFGDDNLLTTGTLGAGAITGTSLTLGGGAITNAINTNWDLAYTHIGESGASHTYIDQSVVSGSSPTFTGTNITGIPAASILAGTFGTGNYTINGKTTITGVPTSAAYDGASLIINPATSTANYLLQSWSVGNSIKASMDEDGDLACVGITASGECQLGNATTDNHGINTAPVAAQGMTEAYVSTHTIGNAYGHRTTYGTSGVTAFGQTSSSFANDVTVSMTGSFTNPGITRNVYGNNFSVSDGSTYNAMGGMNVNAYANFNLMAPSPTITAGLDTYNAYGMYNQVSGNVAGAAVGLKFGMKNLVTGTADINYGEWIEVSGGTLNYGLWIGLSGSGAIVIDGNSVSGSIFFGTAQTSTICYDGTDLLLQPDLVGTGHAVKILTTSDIGREALEINQADIDKAFVNFQGDGSIPASTAENITSWTAGNSIQGFFKVEINGTERWIPYYDAPTS